MVSGLPCLILRKFSTTARRGTDQIRLSKLNQRRNLVRATRICRHLTYVADKFIYLFYSIRKMYIDAYFSSFVFILSASHMRMCSFYISPLSSQKISHDTLVNIAHTILGLTSRSHRKMAKSRNKFIMSKWVA